MSHLLRIGVSLALFAVSGTSLVADPLPGSQLAADKNMCAMCHGDADLWQGDRAKFHISADQMANDIHWAKGVVCHDCHGGDSSGKEFASTHRKEDGFRATAAEIRESCTRCHHNEVIEVSRKSVHAKAGAPNDIGEGTALDCSACHGEVKHQLLPSQDARSPVFVDRQIETCGVCHQRELESHGKSVHRPDLVVSDSTPNARCTDCHGIHGIYRQADRRSTLYVDNVATTCGKCHPGIDSKLLDSVHAFDTDQGDATAGDPNQRENARGKSARASAAAHGLRRQEGRHQATCTACHQRHEPAELESVHREVMQEGCGNCHAKLASQHSIRNHAILTEEGFTPAASCAECHGAHEIVPISDPNSPLSTVNRQETCRKCHEGAVRNFSNFDPHANYKDAESYPRLHSVHVWIERFTIAVLLFFMVHGILWILRSLIQVLQHGGHRHTSSDSRAIIRFVPLQLMIRFLMMFSLLGLAETGLLIKYADYDWAQTVARFLGGVHFTGILHRAFGVLLLGSSAAYIGWLIRKRREAPNRPWKESLFGPDSPLPNRQDVTELFGMLRWFVGMGPKPTFDRWTYWEKFDYWATVSIVVFIGSSGLVIWLPNVFARFLPGAILNEAQMVHHEISLMATSFLLAIRYINTHFRPEKFPMDLSVMTGLVSEEHLKRARPRFLERMQNEGRLEQLRSTFPSRARLRGIIIAAGFVQFAVLVLLAVILVASLSK